MHYFEKEIDEWNGKTRAKCNKKCRQQCLPNPFPIGIGFQIFTFMMMFVIVKFHFENE
jgi:hypothetical protein